MNKIEPLELELSRPLTNLLTRKIYNSSFDIIKDKFVYKYRNDAVDELRNNAFCEFTLYDYQYSRCYDWQ